MPNQEDLKRQEIQLIDETYALVQPKVIHMGRGAVKSLGAELTQRAPKMIFVVTDPMIQSLGILDRALHGTAAFRDRMELFLNPQPDPDISIVEGCASRLKRESFDLILGIGGGSPLDVAKGASALAVHQESARSLLGRNLLKRNALPTILIPTTSGTGTEVSQAAVMEVPEEETKKSIWDPRIVAETAIVDPELATLMPPELTAETGIDALYHAIEGFTAKTSNPIAKLYCLEAIRLIAQYLRKAYNNGEDLGAREAMSRAATLAGIGFSNGGLGAVHGLALALDSRQGFSHGKGLAVLGPWVMKFNSVAHESIYTTIAEALGESTQGLSTHEASQKACDAVTRLALDVGISPYLENHGIQSQDIPGLAQRGYRLSQRLMPMNITEMKEENVLEIFWKAYGKT
ncbi:MAG: iron-containing alcohol dehydrogenase [Desulfobacteraceae bacterium]